MDLQRELSPFDEARRRLLVAMLAGGALAVPGLAGAGLFGRVPRPLGKGRSIYSIRGQARVNGEPAAADTVIGADATIETGADSQLVFVVGRDAFLLRGNARLELEPDPGERISAHTLRVRRGALLSVFGKRRHRVEMPVAQVGIRGTGVYVEVEDGRDYVCTCYGETEVSALADPTSVETIISRHHDAPRYVNAGGAAGARVRAAPFKNHTDEELTLIEALVGRAPPFSVSSSGYSAPRRSTY